MNKYSDYDDYLYDRFLSMLFEIDSNHHSCLSDLVLLKDYPNIMRAKVKDDYIDEIREIDQRLYRHQVNAEKMKNYIEQNLLEHYAISKWDLLIKLQNGDEFIYDSFRNTVDFDRYKNKELTDEDETKEFSRNLRKMLNRNYITQEELAIKIGVSRITVNRYINGYGIPDYLTLKKMANVLNCSVDDFFYKKY